MRAIECRPASNIAELLEALRGIVPASFFAYSHNFIERGISARHIKACALIDRSTYAIVAGINCCLVAADYRPQRWSRDRISDRPTQWLSTGHSGGNILNPLTSGFLR